MAGVVCTPMSSVTTGIDSTPSRATSTNVSLSRPDWTGADQSPRRCTHCASERRSAVLSGSPSSIAPER